MVQKGMQVTRHQLEICSLLLWTAPAPCGYIFRILEGDGQNKDLSYLPRQDLADDGIF